MTTQDRIHELCQAALRKAEWTDTSQEGLEAGTIAVAAPTLPPVLQNQPTPSVSGSETEPEKVEAAPVAWELKQLLAVREGKLARRTKRSRLVANFLMLGMVVLPAMMVAVSPTLRGEFEGLVVGFQQSAGEVAGDPIRVPAADGHGSSAEIPLGLVAADFTDRGDGAFPAQASK